MSVKTPKGKIVRRLGVNIFGNPKYDKLLAKKPNGPGKERGGRTRNKVSVFGEQLKEKQKFRFSYGLSEKQMYNLYKKSSQMTGVTGENMVSLMEQRLDNTIYRAGFTTSRVQARQFVSHCHFLLNGRKANVPSMRIKVGDKITTKNKKGIIELIRASIAQGSNFSAPWLKINEEDLSLEVIAVPTLNDITPAGNIQHVVEFYSRR